MQSVLLTCLGIVLAAAINRWQRAWKEQRPKDNEALYNDVSAQDYSSFYRRLSRLRSPVLITSGGTVSRVYAPPPPPPPTQFGNDSSAPKVRLDVYYETDCPDSMRFITTQLYPLHQEMGDVMEVNLVPFGKAYETYDEEKQEYTFRCQHGPMECYGNTVQSCAMSLYPDQRDYFSFINCMQSYARPSRNGNKCARRLSLDWEKIDKCAKGPEGKRLLHKMAEQTNSLNPRLYFVPWIVVDKVFSDSTQRYALRNLKTVVCETYKGHHKSCKN